MKPLITVALLVTAISVVGFGIRSPRTSSQTDLALPQETHLRNVRQLTFGGENAEAYFSSDGQRLIFQSTRDGRECDQIYTMNIDGSDVKLISTGDGRTTCSYFFPGDKRILYSSTQLGAKQCPPRPDFSKGYVWAVYDTFDIFTANTDGSYLKQLTDIRGYDA
jgi:TolB protein